MNQNNNMEVDSDNYSAQDTYSDNYNNGDNYSTSTGASKNNFNTKNS